MNTKFLIHQKVYFIADDIVLEGIIRGIKSIFLTDYSKALHTTYYIKYNNVCDPIWVNEHSIFNNKTELTNYINRL